MLEVLYAVAPPLYRRLAHGAFVHGTEGAVPAAPAAGNVLRSADPHAVEGGWRARRRPLLRRAFFESAGGALAGLFKRNA
ncbi:MAG: hypothetical protein ACTHNP_10210 [Solirubrobacterales bacterium]